MGDLGRLTTDELNEWNNERELQEIPRERKLGSHRFLLSTAHAKILPKTRSDFVSPPKFFDKQRLNKLVPVCREHPILPCCLHRGSNGRFKGLHPQAMCSVSKPINQDLDQSIYPSLHCDGDGFPSESFLQSDRNRPFNVRALLQGCLLSPCHAPPKSAPTRQGQSAPNKVIQYFPKWVILGNLKYHHLFMSKTL